MEKQEKLIRTKEKVGGEMKKKKEFIVKQLDKKSTEPGKEKKRCN